MQATPLLTVLFVSFFFSVTASAQVFDSGPSDPALFTHVFSFPEDALESINFGGNGGETTQVNIAGGNLREYLYANLGSEVNISGGSVGRYFFAYPGSEVNISGGSVDNFFEAYFGSVVNISGGFVEGGFKALEGSEVNITGGTVGILFNAYSEVNISGGSVGDRFRAREGGVVNISGGSVGESFGAASGSVINISGGTMGDDFTALSGSAVHLFGSSFFLDGVLLDDLILGDALTILDRDVTLSGLLEDGSAFSFDLNSVQAGPQDSFDPGSTLTVTLTPQVLLGDCNLDGVVDFSDIPAFIEILINGEFQAEADVDQNDAVNFSDIPGFIEILLAS